MPKVRVIKPIHRMEAEAEAPKLRVCAYCRVSSDHTGQLQSFSAQVEYYTRLIESNDAWTFAGIYADEGISGTARDKRDEFLRLIADCEAKKVDMVITKSISRFARNTADCIETVRKLKALGIAVFFEKENINTLSAESELLMTVLSSIAQEESISTSKNNRWAIQKRFMKGEWKPSYLPYGYMKGKDGGIVINEEEAAIVRRIYTDYLNGKGTYVIAKELTEEGVPTRKGAEAWGENVVKEILTNEKYYGDMLLQKTFTTDTLPFQRKRNRGQKQCYYIANDHEPIISKEQAERVRGIMEQRKTEKAMMDTDTRKYNQRYPFSSKIQCGGCGSTFKRQIIYKGKPYETEQWCCTKHIRNRVECGMTAIKDNHIKAGFINLYNKLKSNYDKILTPLAEDLKKLHCGREYESQVKEINKKITELTEQSHVLSRLRSKGYLDSVLFIEQSNLITKQLCEAKKQRSKLFEYNGFNDEAARTEELIAFLKKQDDLMESFDENIFSLMVEKIIVKSKLEIAFRLINGLELPEIIGEEVG
ncbi:MAG: recombinase family protein [Bacillota bacterium]